MSEILSTEQRKKLASIESTIDVLDKLVGEAHSKMDDHDIRHALKKAGSGFELGRVWRTMAHLEGAREMLRQANVPLHGMITSFPVTAEEQLDDMLTSQGVK